SGNFETRIAPLGPAETIAFSYGALYHPWPVVRDERGPQQLRALPPDGMMCGLYARQALERGAWIAPANQPLPGVAALTPAVPDDRRGNLLEAQINQIRQEPRGFLNLSADTLSQDALLRSVNVRRLLMLLRRLAIRQGASYVFEANSDSFRRLVKREFESTLGYLFTRGAFVGGTPATSFRVDVSSASGDLDAGRLIVELRVAPVQPLSFLTVRLVQIGDRARVLEVR
ncbi:MAG: phage tail sheath family protein, partial [Roseiflexaceae bacterium]|nr:phage tail sheath family protein [Roseiflexaceae bacterium]